MRSKLIGGALLTTALFAMPVYAANSPKTAQRAVPLTSDSFCGEAHLSMTARADCRQQMDEAKNDAQRFKVERDFALGSVEAKLPPQVTAGK